MAHTRFVDGTRIRTGAKHPRASGPARISVRRGKLNEAFARRGVGWRGQVESLASRVKQTHAGRSICTSNGLARNIVLPTSTAQWGPHCLREPRSTYRRYPERIGFDRLRARNHHILTSRETSDRRPTAVDTRPNRSRSRDQDDTRYGVAGRH